MCHGSSSRSLPTGFAGLRWLVFGAPWDASGRKTQRVLLGEYRADTLGGAERQASRDYPRHSLLVVVSALAWAEMSREQRAVVTSDVRTNPDADIPAPKAPKLSVPRSLPRTPCKAGCGRLTVYKWCRHCPPEHSAARGQWRVAIAKRERAAREQPATKAGRMKARQLIEDCG